MADSTTRKPATPEEIWKILREASEMQKETDKRWERLEIEAEKDRQAAEKAREAADRRMEQMSINAEKDRQESAKARRKMQKRSNELQELFEGHWGKLMEALVEGDLVELLKERGIQVEKTYPNEIRRDSNKNKIAQFDIIAANGKEVVVVEVKTTMTSRHVNHFAKRMGRIREFLPEYAGKPIYGAMAYLKSGKEVRAMARRNGFFVIRATGSSASIINEEDFKPAPF